MEMNLRKALGVTLVAMLFCVAVGAAAKPKDSRTMVLLSDAIVTGSHLASGTYNVRWTSQSPAAAVSFLQEGKVVATATGKIVDRGKKYESNEVVYDRDADGAHVIVELRFRGSSEVIVFNE
jgi:hypothetical protein